VGSSSRDIRGKVQIQVDSDQSVSEQASNVSGPDLGPDLGKEFTVDDQRFAAMLGSDIPARESSRPFHDNSSLLEVGESWLGAKFKARVVTQFKQTMGGNSSDETLNKMFEEMANNMPLRALALFSGGSLSMAQIRLVIAILNHQYVRALKLWLQR
jgi:beta-glucosidase